jgi:hypothetical protein
MRCRRAIVPLTIGALLLTPAASAVLDVPGDPTPPVVTPVISQGTLGSNGWYVSNVTITWTVADPESIILSTTGCNTSTLNVDTPGAQYSCSATSDGGTTTVSKPLKLDKTPPTATAAASRSPNSNGWYNASVTVSFSGTDATSGIDTCTQTTYSGPDTSSTPVSGTCHDKAGNQSATSSLTLRYDATPPQANAFADRAADSNGWYNHALAVSFSGSDEMSGLQSCDGPKSYGSPDTAGTSVSGTCTDRAGNSTTRSYAFKFDSTAPQASASATRVPDVNGWYNHALTVNFSGSDATSGLDSCPASREYAGPDGAAAIVSGTCSDKAGNTRVASLTIKYDQTPPQVTASPGRAPDSNGWFSSPLTVSFGGSDGTSGVSTCSAAQSYGGPDNASALIGGTCKDQAGNVGSASYPLKYDATPPVIGDPSPARAPDSNGWYNHAVAVGFPGSDATSGIDACTQASYAGPDTGAGSISGSCTDRAGNQSAVSAFGFKYDGTPPEATASPSRPADANGWYNHALAVGFAGSDSLSGLESCSAPQGYAGPDSRATAVVGACVDKAGNAATASFPLKYDQTAPSVSSLRATPGNHSMRLTWSASGDASYVEIKRAPGRKGEAESVVYRGSASSVLDAGLTAGRRYTYRVAAVDEAANSADKAVAVTATGPLLMPAPGARVSSPPRLVWTAVKKASYYNLQLVRDGRVLSTWPVRPSFQLRRTWIYKGRRYRLRPGVYRWYVWPGFGRVSAAHYGRLLGGSTFVVRG